ARATQTREGGLAPRCEPSLPGLGRPRSVDQAVSLINALPRPLTLDCFLSALERPLSIVATESTISAQPAVGRENPRLFLMSNELVMSVATSGAGASLLEFGEFVDARTTIKGELKFPILGTAPLSAAAPFARISGPQGTSCGLCHEDEDLLADSRGRVYASLALRPSQDEEIELAEVRNAWMNCDAAVEPQRCARLDGVFAYGELEQGHFAESLPTIFDR
ncbi:MAG: hypothetical protein KUG77_12770, partial [Nannocystaceae bacterium]|nr:hypothetical protein [Nannocystaceae bacterium]